MQDVNNRENCDGDEAIRAANGDCIFHSISYKAKTALNKKPILKRVRRSLDDTICHTAKPKLVYLLDYLPASE
jgi:hypothetical protein